MEHWSSIGFPMVPLCGSAHWVRDGIQVSFNSSPYHCGMSTFRRFLKDESGATAIEYGLIAAGIALAVIAVVNGLGSKLNTKFTSINASLK